MSENVCPQCGAPITPGASECKYCGEKFVQQQVNQQMYQQPQPQVVYVQQPVVQQPQQQYQQYANPAINPAWPVKNKLVAGILALLLGGIGVQFFYLGKIGLGILMICLCWTGIPSLIGVIHGIMLLTMNDENYMLKYNVRTETYR